MEKILLLQHINGSCSGALDFACYLATLTNSQITGVFPDNIYDEEKLVEQQLTTAATSPWPEAKPLAQIPDSRYHTDDAIASFKKSCEARSARYSIHVTKEHLAEAIIRESRYADLLIVDADITLKNTDEQIPSSFLTVILKETECPVFIAPQSFEGTEEVVFAYDGSKSCMHAIKQFCYLFPQLDDKKVTALRVSDKDQEDINEHNQLKEWLSAHYNSIGFVTVKGDAKTELMAYLLKKENTIVVMGAYGRSNAAAVLKHSHADPLLKILNQPIFIAHP